MIIDPPSPFAPTSEWQAFIVELKAIRPQTDQVKRAISDAEAEIKRRNDLQPAS